MSATSFGPAIVRPWYIDARHRAEKRHRAVRTRRRHRAAANLARWSGQVADLRKDANTYVTSLVSDISPDGRPW